MIVSGKDLSTIRIVKTDPFFERIGLERIRIVLPTDRIGFRLFIYNPDLKADWYMVMVLIYLICCYNYEFIDVNLVAK